MQPELGTSAIQPIQPPIESWFEYPVRVHAHHTDCAGIVWHGSYVAWLEEARVECLRSLGVAYADWVAMGLELPVVELAIHYHQALRMGELAVVKTRMLTMKGVRINWDYQIQSPNGQETYVTAQVTLVAINRENGKIMRQLPPVVQETLAKLAALT